MRAHPCVGWFELCSPPLPRAGTLRGPAGLSWDRLRRQSQPSCAGPGWGLPAERPAQGGRGRVPAEIWAPGDPLPSRVAHCVSIPNAGCSLFVGAELLFPSPAPRGPSGPALPRLPPWKG